MAPPAALKLWLPLPCPFVVYFPLRSVKRFATPNKTGQHISQNLRLIRSEMSFSAGTRLIPHPAKVEKGGEDAYFVSSYKGGVLGIADGVSG